MSVPIERVEQEIRSVMKKNRITRQELISTLAKQGIKFSELIPKAEVVDITSNMIERITSTTSLTNLQNYADNVSMDLLLPLIKKFTSVTPTLTDGKKKLLTQLLNTYFSDVEYVTQIDLTKIDPKIEKWASSSLLGSKCLKGKIVFERPEFNSNNLSSDIAVKMLDYWKDDRLISYFTSTSVIGNLVKIPGSHWLYSGDELKFDGDALDYVVTKAIDFKLGARGLRSICEAILTDAMFELPSSSEIKEFRVTRAYAEGQFARSKMAKLKAA
jgi:hypothetical protein